MFLTIKTRIELEEFEKEVEYWSELLNFCANKLIENNWKEEYLSNFSCGYSKNFFKEKEAILPIYLPNRAKRMIFELAGSTLKSQYQAFTIYETLKTECLDLSCSYKDWFSGLSWTYVASILRRIKKWRDFYWIGSIGTENVYLNSLKKSSFFEFQKMPELNKVVLPYYQDDNQMIKIDYENGITLIKLPYEYALNKQEWKWYSTYFTLHDKLLDILNQYQVKKPTIVLKRRKSGSYYYEMNIPYEVKPKKLKKKKRVLGIDLGIKKFAVLTVIEEYKHSRPVFIKNDILYKLKRLRDQMSGIQKNLSRIKKEDSHKEFKTLHAYYRRVQNKFRALNRQVAHEVSKFIVYYAEATGCDTIAFEGLKRTGSNYSKDLNWLISNWIKGKIIDYTKYKARIKGIRVEKVNKNYTSRRCSKCGALGKTYKNSYLKEENKAGGHFKCNKCGYSADRDYNASLNIARLCLSGQKDIRKVSKVVTYMATTSLGNRSLRAYSELEKGATGAIATMNIATMNIVLKHIRDKSWVVSVSPVQYVTKYTYLY